MTLATVTVDTQLVNGTDANPKLKRHEKYWLDDGSIILRSQDSLYKVHRTLLHRHSSLLPTLSSAGDAHKIDELEVVQIPEDRNVKSIDVEALLEHLYHDASLDDMSSVPKIASLLRASSKEQLDFPAIHTLARNRLKCLFPSDPEAFNRPAHAEEALALAVDYDVPSISKVLYYSVATHPHEEDPSAPETHSKLPPELSARCDTLLEQIISHFTPILFTVATAGHMACTDVLAEKWMPLVIQPALDDNGLCRPLETLDRIIAIDWAAEGLCEECAKDKAEEWRGEQRAVWEQMDEWLR